MNASDMMEAVKSLKEPIAKLREALSSVIGASPTHIKELADADAHAINKISEAVRNNSDIPIIYKSARITIDTSDTEALLKRAGSRLAYQEIKKQENIETIVSKACGELEGKESLSDEKVNPEWMNRYINMAGDISTEEMQDLWAKVLAGEVVRPNSFSMRTLECLRNLSTADARLFEKVSEFVISEQFLYNDSNKGLNAKYGVTYTDLLTLDDCGLINSTGMVSRKMEVSNQESIFVDFGDYILLASSQQAQQGTQAIFWQYPLLRAGKELLRVARKKIYDLDYIKGVVASIKEHNTNIKLTLHKVNERLVDKVACDPQEIMV